MSSKFFTWTKGDRHNVAEHLRSGRVVPIPVECIAIKGLDYARTEKGSSKASSKPAPLIIAGSPTPSSKHSSRTNNSMLLQDAAVKSATSLITAMNDMLLSPHLSSHLHASQLQSTGLTYGHPRVRAYTAPSTPLRGIPPMDPVELPGSFPEDVRNCLSAEQALHGDNCEISDRLGKQIIRPQSSPQQKTYTLPSQPRRISVETFYRDVKLVPSWQSLPHSRGCSPPPNFDSPLPSYDAEEPQLEKATQTIIKSVKRPQLSVLPLALPKSSGLSTPVLTSQPGSMQAVPQLGISQFEDVASLTDDMASVQADTEATLIEQISKMRASHDLHLRSLKETHEKEILSHQSYIRFLESRQRFHPDKDDQSIPSEASQTDRSRGMSEAVDNLTAVQTSKSPDSHDGLSTDSLESMKRKLSLYRKAQAHSMEVRKERDQLRATADRNERRILQLKDIIRKTKDNERPLKNCIANLEARLVAANNQRIDVLDGFQEASGKLHAVSQREKALTQELQDLSNTSAQVPWTSKQDDPIIDKQCLRLPRHKRTFSDIGGASRSGIQMSHQIQDLQRLVWEKECRIRELEEAQSKQGSTASSGEASPLSDRISKLECDVEHYKKRLAMAQADTERYNSLLHNELRRQSRQTAEKNLAPIPQIDAEAAAATREKLAQLNALSSENMASGDEGNKVMQSSSSNTLIASLEKELEYCIKEIILYKLDVKGYKKDLKKANAKVESLEATSVFRPPTPDRESPSSVRSQPSATSHRRHRSGIIEQSMVSAIPSEPGLGISLPEAPRMVERRLNSPMSSPCAPATPVPRPSTISGPPEFRPRTPLSTHKKLPKPPSFVTPTPLPLSTPRQAKAESGETLRSFSESLLASNASVSAVEMRHGKAKPSNDISILLSSMNSPETPPSKSTSKHRTEG